MKVSKVVFSIFTAFCLICAIACSSEDDNPPPPPPDDTEIPLHEKMQFFVVVFEDESTTVKLPLSGTVDCVVEWGDGTKEKITQPHPIHNYEKGDLYDVHVSGTVTALTTDGFTDAELSLIHTVNNWGNTGLTEMVNAFRGCTMLSFLPDNNPKSLANVRSFRGAFANCINLTKIPSFVNNKRAEDFTAIFQGCERLTEIPERLFADSENAVYFSDAFKGCTKLTEIPEKLFTGCKYAEYFDATFQDCERLMAIPEKLFAGCKYVNHFESTFRNCVSLTRIPEGLFADCPQVVNFTGTFRNCTSLSTLPAALFDQNMLVQNFWLTFYGCAQLTGESPYTLVNGKKIHLYERNENNGFAATVGYGCFHQCTGLSDVDQIPMPWK